MGRLVDADALLEHIKKLECHAENKKYEQGLNDFLQCYLPQIIDNQPTAYDVEKVVAELEVEKERHDADRSYWAEHEWKDRVIYNECDMSDKKSNCFDLSIDIVKRGGVE